MDWTAGIGAAATISAVSAIISLSAAMVNARFSNRKDARDLVEIRIKYFDGIRRWAEQGADLLSEAVHLCDLRADTVAGDTIPTRCHKLRVSLSACVDKGRWFFPNDETESYGVHKPVGARGFRAEVLDSLMVAYRVLGYFDVADSAEAARSREKLVSAQRQFARHVQVILDPGTQRMHFDRVTARRKGKR